MSYKMYNFTLTLSPHYLVKLKQQKQHIRKSVVTLFYYLASVTLNEAKCSRPRSKPRPRVWP